jgi:1,4-dihydroxy-2-naphthoate polyprenyltransferase
VLLLPVFLWALCVPEQLNFSLCIQVFIILHMLVYPSSNGYNSYMDRDTGPIGGLSAPPPPNRFLFFTTILFDSLALIWSFFINHLFALGVCVYILMSRLYSYRGIRLKKYPLIGFLTVFVFQGAWVYLTTLSGVAADFFVAKITDELILKALISSLFIGAIYPLTQIYQHESDLKDGVKTLSYLLGYKGTFAFSALCFAGGSSLLFFVITSNQFIIFNVCMLPTLVFFGIWFMKVYKNTTYANFKNTMWMNLTACISMIVFYMYLLLDSV